MALLDRPLTSAEIRTAISSTMPIPEPFDFSEPSHYFVNYTAPNSPAYTTPEEFYWGPRPGPSDCVWMVPCVTRHWSGRRSFWKVAP